MRTPVLPPEGFQRSEPALYGPRINGEALSAPFQPSDFLITSGMLVPVPVLDRLQGWRKDFRVDALDVDLVMRARLAGIPIYKVDAGNLVQQFGKRRKTHGFYVYDYSPRRLYDIFRNHILVIRTYPSVSSDLRRMFVKRWVFSRIPRILLGEKGRREKLRAILRGIRAGFRAHPRPVVGVVTWFGTPNYGTTLQAFALVEALRHLGVSPFLIRRFDDPVSFRAVKDNWNRRLGIRRFWKYAPDAWPEKTRKIKQFCREHLPVRFVTGPRSLRRLKRDVDLFLCGSDQLWNVRDHLRPFEFLGFADGCRKAAFATSIGTEDVPPEHARRVRSYLEDFGSISLRELSGVQALSRLTGRDDLVQVADPTFLLTSPVALSTVTPSTISVVPSDFMARAAGSWTCRRAWHTLYDCVAQSMPGISYAPDSEAWLLISVVGSMLKASHLTFVMTPSLTSIST